MRDFPVPSVLMASILPRGTSAATARPAATVALIRDAQAGGVEVFMFHRAETMKFAPGMRVFPGGRVDSDDTAEASWLDPGTVAAWSRALDLPDAPVRGLLTACVREVYEETGVLLVADPSALPAALAGPDSHAVRAEMETGSIPFAAWCLEHGVTPDVRALHLLGRWITPEAEPRRYDTIIVVAELPPGAAPDFNTSEAVVGGWVRPADVLAEYERSRNIMLPPTVWALELLDSLDRAADVGRIAAQDPVAAILPVLVETPDGAVMRCDIAPRP